MPANDRRKILRLIIDDPASTPVERIEAQRALGEITTDQSTSPPPRRHGRNTNVPQTQADQDSDIENHWRLLRDNQLTTRDRIDIERGLDESTRAILDAIGNTILWLFHDNLAELDLMIDLQQRTRSDIVKAKALAVITHIGNNSPDQTSRDRAIEFMNQLDNNQPQEN